MVADRPGQAMTLISTSVLNAKRVLVTDPIVTVMGSRMSDLATTVPISTGLPVTVTLTEVTTIYILYIICS